MSRTDITLSEEDLELIPDDELEITFETPPKPLYYMEYVKDSDLDGTTKSGKFHSDYIKPLVRRLRAIGITILLLRRESDKKVLIYKPVEALPQTQHK